MPDWRLPKLAVALVGLALLQGVEADPSFAVVGDVAIIRVKDTRNNVYRESGSGLLLGQDGYILTARHVVEKLAPYERIVVNFKDPSLLETEGTFKYCATDPDVDACVITVRQGYVSGAKLQSSDIECRSLTVHESVHAVGWPIAGKIGANDAPGEVTGGLITSGVVGYPTTAQALEGMSGGPVFDAHDNAIGIVKGGFKAGDQVVVTPLEKLRVLIGDSSANCAMRFASDTVEKILQRH